MKSTELQVVLESWVKMPTQFLGVFPKDMIPPFRPNTCFVANIDPACMPGQHWIAFFVDADRDVEYFDSYGEPPSLYGFILNAARVLSYPVQALDSDTCGEHCIFYLIMRSRDFDLAQIRSRYQPTKLGDNDIMVRRFTIKLLRHLITLNPRRACLCNQCSHKR